MAWSEPETAKEIEMLGERNAYANLAVKDLARAKAFYEGTLGLTPVHTMGEELVAYRSGETVINVYRSEYAGTNQATAVTWGVGEEIDEVVLALAAKGVTFEHYEMPGATLEGDVHVDGELRVAWFKDPDGNILNLVNQ